jgi:hypothetical protein
LILILAALAMVEPQMADLAANLVGNPAMSRNARFCRQFG